MRGSFNTSLGIQALGWHKHKLSCLAQCSQAGPGTHRVEGLYPHKAWKPCFSLSKCSLFLRSEQGRHFLLGTRNNISTLPPFCFPPSPVSVRFPQDQEVYLRRVKFRGQAQEDTRRYPLSLTVKSPVSMHDTSCISALLLLPSPLQTGVPDMPHILLPCLWAACSPR